MIIRGENEIDESHEVRKLSLLIRILIILNFFR